MQFVEIRGLSKFSIEYLTMLFRRLDCLWERKSFLFGIQKTVSAAKRVEFHGGVAHRFELRGGLGKENRVARSLVPAVGIHPQLRALLTTE